MPLHGARIIKLQVFNVLLNDLEEPVLLDFVSPFGLSQLAYPSENVIYEGSPHANAELTYSDVYLC